MPMVMGTVNATAAGRAKRSADQRAVIRIRLGEGETEELERYRRAA